jgi:hypothetical protein
VSGTLTADTIAQSAVADPSWLAQDSSANAIGTFEIGVDSVTANYASKMIFKVDEITAQGGEDVTYMTIDGDAQEITFAKPINAIQGFVTSPSSGNIGFIDLYEDPDSAGNEYVRLQAPTSLAATLTFTLPSADGTTSGDVLATDAAGTLYFTSAGATLWNLIGDAALDGTVLFAGTQQTIGSTLDAASEIVLKIDHTDADVTNATTNLYQCCGRQRRNTELGLFGGCRWSGCN